MLGSLDGASGNEETALRMQQLPTIAIAAGITSYCCLTNVAAHGRSSMRLALPLASINFPRMWYEYGVLGLTRPTVYSGLPVRPRTVSSTVPCCCTTPDIV